MGKLHQLLAVEKDVKRTALKMMEEVKNLFKNKAERFNGLFRKYVKVDEDGPEYQPERKAMVTTVGEKLDYFLKRWRPYLELTIAKEETNASGNATAEVMVDDKSFGTFNVTALLALEKNMELFIGAIREIPTLDPTHEWKLEDGKYVSKHSEETQKTMKRSRPIILYEATKEHPAQVEMTTYDVVAGTWTSTRSSGKFSPKEKADLLERAEQFLLAVQKARSKANSCDVKTFDSSGIFDYIFDKKA